jgi:hypothetical protein
MTDRAARLTTLNVLWMSMLAAVPIYAAVTWFAPAPAESALDPAALVVFPLIAVGETAFVVLAPRFLEGDYMTTCIIRWALAESVALFGLVVHFLGGPAWLAYVLMGWSFLLIAALGPSRAALEGSD